MFKFEIASNLSWPANAGHPGDATRVSKKDLGGPVKPGHDRFWNGVHCAL
jgi:hypothetical protein